MLTYSDESFQLSSKMRPLSNAKNRIFLSALDPCTPFFRTPFIMAFLNVISKVKLTGYRIYTLNDHWPNMNQ